MLVIETNLSMDGNNQNIILDHQSRVIKIDSWEDFISEIKEARCITRQAHLGGMYGNTVPRSSRVENLTYDDDHLMCDIYNYAGRKTKKLAYIIK